jgi:hypothetical protein
MAASGAGYFNNNMAMPAMPAGGAMFGNNAPGSNQNGGVGFGSMPGNTSMPASGGGYYNPTTSPYNNPGYGPSGGPLAPGGPSGPGASHNLGHGIIATGPEFPGLSSGFANYLMGQIGQGLTPFGGSVGLPTGGATQPGQLNAPLNPLLQQLMTFFQGGGGAGMPGMDTLGTIASQGVSALPEWQSMIQAQQQNIQQGQTNLQGQFATMGDLAGSGFGNAMQNYNQGTQATQNSLLAQLQQSNIQNIQMPAIQSMLSGETQMAGGLQNLNQQAINSYLQQFQTDQPQNNPMNSFLGAFASLFPPTSKTPTTMDTINSTIGALSGSGFSSGGGSTGTETAIQF